ncbi:hypothetical protein [Promicromonospora sp. MEB111]|uniref:hypothetical protein n=1 Tax=Promicromonospora sp. MEB111 TaxID=3040301 RepID=UPI00254DE838|nr:hypothetical protein [Promicromonospora sp. MEB111]
MHSSRSTENLRLLSWQRVREYAVPPPMIEISTARRQMGDWAGACAAAHVDLDVNLRDLRHRHGAELPSAVRADLRHLAPDLLRWHMPRVLPDGLLRPGTSCTLARYHLPDGGTGHLVVRTPPAWAAGPQRMSLAWWDAADAAAPHPDRRFRLDLHRHLWDVRRSDELAERAGRAPEAVIPVGPDPAVATPSDWAVTRWAAEAALLVESDGAPDSGVVVYLGARRLVLRLDDDGTPWPPTPEDLADLLDEGRLSGTPQARRRRVPGIAVLPNAATWVPPDVLLLRAGLIAPGDLHPLVAHALAPGSIRSRRPEPAPGTRQVECRGALHRLAVVDGVLTALDHPPDEVRREELLARLGGTPLPCLHVIDQLHRAPTALADVRARLDHGDVDSALAVIENLLGPEAVLRVGDLQDELAAVAAGRTAYGAYRAGLLPLLLDIDPEVPPDPYARSDQSFRARVVASSTPRRQRDRHTRRLLAASH